MRTATEGQPRRRWLVGAMVVVAVVAGAAGGLLLAPSSDQQTTAGPAPVPPAPPATTGVPGCLGGAVLDNAMIRAAQAQAPNDADGAAAFAGAVLRWLGSEPGPGDVEDLEATIAQVLAPQVSARVRSDLDVAVQYAREDRSVDDWTVTTAGGGYYVESGATDRVRVSVLGERFDTGGQLQVVPMTFDLAYTDRGWSIADWGQAARAPDDLRAVMTAFAEGC